MVEVGGGFVSGESFGGVVWVYSILYSFPLSGLRAWRGRIKSCADWKIFVDAKTRDWMGEEAVGTWEEWVKGFDGRRMPLFYNIYSALMDYQ